MARPTVNILFNVSGNDTPCTNPAGDANFILLAAGDFVVWRDGQQSGGDLLSGVSYPTIIPESGDLEAEKMFLMDNSSGEYEHIVLAGTEDGGYSGGNNRYVCCAWFSGATATIPYLEAYDDNSHATWASKPLGDGTPANSCFKAITTTNAVPGSATWVGTALAGTDSRISLDTGALAGVKYLYWNMKQILSDSMSAWSTADWYNNDLVFAIHFTYS
jgi:hypothetical protein